LSSPLKPGLRGCVKINVERININIFEYAMTLTHPYPSEEGM